MSETTTFDVKSAFDERLLETFDSMDEDAVLAALERAYRLYQDRESWLSAIERTSVLSRFFELVSEKRDMLARQAAEEGGKPLRDSKVEIDRALNGVQVAIAEISRLHGTEVPMGLSVASQHRVAYTYREPRGVVLAISAFNHPFNLIIHQVITAIATGCPVLVKPASATPRSCRSIVQLLQEAGLRDGYCQLILTTNQLTERLVSDRRVAFLTFIGSAKVGWHLRSCLAQGATSTLEHGGVAPVIVDASADIEASIAPLVKGGFYHAGQVCVSVQRIYLQREIVDKFSQKFVEAVRALRVGDPLLEETDVGPLIHRSEVERVEEWVQEAKSYGAQLLCGGHRLSATTYAPTVLLDPPDDVRLSREEIFGPVVALYTYDKIDDAVARANAPDSFFQAAIFTRDLDTALDVSRRLHGMTVMVNDHTAFRVDWMPFGGHQNSGLGLGGIAHSMKEMTIERMVVFHSSKL